MSGPHAKFARWMRKYWTVHTQIKTTLIRSKPGEMAQKMSIPALRCLAPQVLPRVHAENTVLPYRRIFVSHRLRHHGGDEKAHLLSAQQRDALGIAFLKKVVFSWRAAKADRQFLFNRAASSKGN
jgi:hypothetical protein